jgi:hypothetical protein
MKQPRSNHRCHIGYVMPADAGIQALLYPIGGKNLDSRVRGNRGNDGNEDQRFADNPKTFQPYLGVSAQIPVRESHGAADARARAIQR